MTYLVNHYSENTEVEWLMMTQLSLQLLHHINAKYKVIATGICRGSGGGTPGH